MTDYRVYIVGAEGHFCDVVPLACGEDEEAIRLARELAIDRDVELWQLEPPRVCRRPFGLSYAAMAGCSSMA